MAEKRPLPQLAQLKHVHIVGVCGTLMGSFALFLNRRGIKVTGSDQNIYPPMSDLLRQASVVLFDGYKADHLNQFGPKVVDLVVIGNVARSDNPEAREAIDKGYAYCSLPEAMENLILRDTTNLVVAGTHGKTTTSAILSHVLVTAGKDPGYFIGGVVKDLPFNFHVPSVDRGKFFVLEGDEYDTAFWDKVPKFNHYLPDNVILTSIEYDHADIYPDFASVCRAFDGLMKRIRPGGKIIACYDYPAVRDAVEKSSVPVIAYGAQSTEARYSIGKQSAEHGTTRFEILEHGKPVDELTVKIPGNHNLLNALAVWIQCNEIGIDRRIICDAFASFQGVRRRQEIRAVVNGIIVMDDFGHHPTAVRETLKALRSSYSSSRLIAVFEPRSATSRRKIFQEQYASAFDDADAAFISEPYDTSRIVENEQFSSEKLISDIKKRKSHCSRAEVIKAIDDGVSAVAEFAKPDDLIVVLSNGGFGGFIPKLIEVLKAKNHG